MKLGNSGGNNKGKKYLDRNNLDYSRLTAKDYIRLDDFNTWYTDNIDEIEQSLKDKGCFIPDVVNDTYVKICEKILFDDPIIKDYKSYFCRAEYTNRVQYHIQQSRYTLPEEQMLSVHIHTVQNNWDNNENNQELLNKIFQFVQDNHSDRDYYLFFRYMNLEDRNYNNLSELTGLKTHILQRVIHNIKRNIILNKENISKKIVSEQTTLLVSFETRKRLKEEFNVNGGCVSQALFSQLRLANDELTKKIRERAVELGAVELKSK